jgi:hypothetical protein
MQSLGAMEDASPRCSTKIKTEARCHASIRIRLPAPADLAKFKSLNRLAQEPLSAARELPRGG